MSYLAANRSLLDKFRAGDPTGLAEVYRHYAPGVARYLLRGFPLELEGAPRFGGWSRPLELADAVQETFARAFADRARLSYDGLNPYAAFLSGIARNLVLEHLRRRQSVAATLAGLANETACAAPAAGPDLAAEEAEASRLVRAFSEHLEEPDRSLFRIRFFESQSQEEAARVLGVTRIRLRRAELRLRQRLLEHLKGSGYLERLRLVGWGLARIPDPFRGGGR